MNFPIWVDILIIAFLGTFAWAGIVAAPWIPIRRKDVDRLLSLAQPKAGEWLCDLGCGDGRILVRAAQQYQVRGVGYEISLLPYLLCWSRIWLSRVWPGVTVRYRNFYHQTLSQADVVTVFLTPKAMARLGRKFISELKPGARVVSYAFPIPDWTPAMVSKPTATSMSIYVYRAWPSEEKIKSGHNKNLQ